VQGFISGDAKQKSAQQAINDTVTSANFVNLLQKTLMVLKPINTAIIFYQSDAVPVSEVFYTFGCKIPSAILAMPIPHVEFDYLMRLCQHCFDFIYGNAHSIAYLLDPHYVGDLMPVQMHKRIEELIYMQQLPDGEEPTSLSEEEMFIQYTSFCIAALLHKNTAPPSLAFCMLAERKVSVFSFWMSRGDQWPRLQKLAQQVFSMVASSVASECNFTTFGFIHLKLRNCLSPDAVQKLVYIKTKNLQFTKQASLEKQFDEEDHYDNLMPQEENAKE
jgi:hAT family C-terminal dimerisation region